MPYPCYRFSLFLLRGQHEQIFLSLIVTYFFFLVYFQDFYFQFSTVLLQCVEVRCLCVCVCVCVYTALSMFPFLSLCIHVFHLFYCSDIVFSSTAFSPFSPWNLICMYVNTIACVPYVSYTFIFFSIFFLCSKLSVYIWIPISSSLVGLPLLPFFPLLLVLFYYLMLYLLIFKKGSVYGKFILIFPAWFFQG